MKKELSKEIVNELWGKFLPAEEVRKSELFKRTTKLMYEKELSDNSNFFRKYGKKIDKYLENDSNFLRKSGKKINDGEEVF